MTYETYHTVFLSAGILAIIFAVCSVLLLVFFKIPKVVGDLSGRTARKGIADIREQNVRTGDKRHKTSAVNMDRGRITDRITDSGNIQHCSETVVLDEIRMDDDFSIEEEICFIHTDETIG